MSLERLASELKIFRAFPDKLKKQGLSVEVLGDFCFSLQNKSFKKTLKTYDIFLSALIHGNEVGGAGVLNALLEYILNNPNSLKTKLLIHLGNVDAALKGVRFLEKDLNRSFLNNRTESLEERLARKIEDLVKDCAYNLDLHQTNSSSKTPFFIFSYSQNSMNWARFLDPKIPAITSVVERHKDGSTLDFFCTKNNIPSCTLELGQAGFDGIQIEYGAKTLGKILDLPDITQANFNNMYKVLETIYWDQKRIYLNPGFENFSSIQKGQPLGQYEDKSEFLAPYTGALLFPKYGKIADQTKELVTFAIPIQSIQDLEIP